MERMFRLLLTLVLITGLATMPVGAKDKKTDQALDLELSEGTRELLRVIVRTVPDTDVLKRLEDDLKDMMKDAGSSSKPLVHPLLFAVSAEIARDQVAVLEADPEVTQISTDAVVRGFSEHDTDTLYAQLKRDREALVARLVDELTASEQAWLAELARIEAEALATQHQHEALMASFAAAVSEQQTVVVQTQEEARELMGRAQAAFDRETEAI
jgi:hypothetical protein